jgi:hypothetical protein
MTMIKDLLAKHEEWNCFFKVKKMYIQFIPNSSFTDDLDELLN